MEFGIWTLWWSPMGHPNISQNYCMSLLHVVCFKITQIRAHGALKSWYVCPPPFFFFFEISHLVLIGISYQWSWRQWRSYSDMIKFIDLNISTKSELVFACIRIERRAEEGSNLGKKVRAENIHSSILFNLNKL